MNSTTTFQHAPYGYHALPAQFRTVQTPPPRSPPAQANTDSLGALTNQSSSSSFEADESYAEVPPTKHHEQQLTSVFSPHYQQQQHHQQLPSAAPLFCPAPRSTTGINSGSDTMYDQSCMPTPPPPSYTVALTSTGANPASPTANFSPKKSQRPQPLSNAATTAPFAQAPGSGETTPVQHSTFKAHFALEKVGVPYFQFPHGGMLPTPAHWPQHCTIDGSAAYPNTYRAFIGQVRFETTTEQIAWVLEQVTGVTAAFVAYHRNGCFVAHFLTEAECEIATSHHKKILFDLNGVWNLNDARPDQTQALGQVLRHKPNLHKHRLPRGCMVCEPFASTRNTGGIPTFPHHTHNQQQYPPVQHHHQQQQGQNPNNHAAIAPNVHSRDNSW
jgi:hypothetical protein